MKSGRILGVTIYMYLNLRRSVRIYPIRPSQYYFVKLTILNTSPLVGIETYYLLTVSLNFRCANQCKYVFHINHHVIFLITDLNSIVDVAMNSLLFMTLLDDGLFAIIYGFVLPCA